MPPVDPGTGYQIWSESASFPLLLENLRRHAEIAAVGRARFPGTLAQKNSSWREYRNFLRQGLSNYEAALGVPNRSACLLYYYAMLNFAKAELLSSHAAKISGQFVGHGLSFSPKQAQTVSGDSLVVKEGVFRWLYEQRTGTTLPVGMRIPVKRLLVQIPEIGTQVADAGMGDTQVLQAQHMVAADHSQSWPLILLLGGTRIDASSVTGKLFFRHFRETQIMSEWRDHFGISRRLMTTMALYESRLTAPSDPPGTLDISGAHKLTMQIRGILSMRINETADVTISPSLYKTKMIPMPSSLARYAIAYYASSLVRYKPSVFDSQIHPEQAYMFDAVARECALPMLIDTLTGLEGKEQYFFAGDSFRV